MQKLLHRVLAFSLVLILCVSASPAQAAETAAAIRLFKVEGTASAANSGGRSLTIRDNMRLYNGYHVSTEAASYAWFQLDSDKLDKLDEASEVEIRKSGKLLELLLNEGNLYFNVTAPLKDDESLNIRTSTMVVGIRGTSGWVKVLDPYNTQVYVLEGTVWCTITDPVSGQRKITVLTGGETALFTVYSQEQNGERCAIIQERYTESDIDGFVLAELLGDEPMCEKIYTESGLDLRGLTAEQVQEQLTADQAATAERIRQQEALEASKEHNVSIDPVWGTNTGGGSSGGGGGGSSGGGSSTQPETPPSSIARLTMPVTDMQVQQELNKAEISQVIVSPGEDPARNILEIGISMAVDAGKTLTLESGVPAEIMGSLTVDGTADLGSDVTNNGTITVNSANTLRVGGTLTNQNQFIVTATGRSITEGSFLNTGSVTLTQGAQVLAHGFTLTAQIPGWRVAAEQLDGYDVLEADIPQKSVLTLNFNNGEDPEAVETDDNGRLTGPLPEPERDGYVFEGWFTEEGTTQASKKVTEDTQFTGDTALYAVWSSNVGDFKVSGGDFGTDYSFGPEKDGYNVLTVLTAEPLTIAMKDGVAQTTTDRVLVADGVSANFTLSGVDIDLSATGDVDEYGIPAMEIAENSTGNVTVTLAEGSENQLLSGNSCAGLQKNGGTGSGTLTINGSGTMTATGGSSGAGIGGGDQGEATGITITGSAEVTATGGGGAGIGGGFAADGRQITISGSAKVTARGGFCSAGIGGGGGSGTGSAGDGVDITITGNAEVTAIDGGGMNTTGGGACIGGGGGYSTMVSNPVTGGSGRNITISGGTVRVENTRNGGADIGGGDNTCGGAGSSGGNTENIIISGGIVYGGISAASYGVCDTVTVTGGAVYGSIYVDSGTFQMTGGEVISEGTTVSVSDGVTLELLGGTLTNNATYGSALQMESDSFPENCGTQLRSSNATVVSPMPEGWRASELQDDGYYYLVRDTGGFDVEGGTYGTDYTYARSGANGVLTILSDTQLTIRNTDPATPIADCILVQADQDADIILAGVNIESSDAAAFEIAGNSQGNVTITLAEGSQNILTSGGSKAGLSKNQTSSGAASGTLTINGPGELTATGDTSGGAGIGANSSNNPALSDRFCTKNIVINGGKITATGGGAAAGIGGGGASTASSITINGGEITATGGSLGGAGIGSGSGNSSGLTASASDINILGGTVIASGGNNGAGIGGGDRGNASGITISGGVVTATGSNDGSGIGGGAGTNYGGEATGITITGSAEVTATGGGTGIGGGFAADGRQITISGSAKVTAKGGSFSAGIGGGGASGTGSAGDGVDITITGNAEVTAIGGSGRNDSGGGACIGGGGGYSGSNTPVAGGSGRNITISGGTVWIESGASGGADIGGGDNFYGGDSSGGNTENIVISGGTIQSKDGYGISISAGFNGVCDTVTVTGGAFYGSIYVDSGTFQMTGGEVISEKTVTVAAASGVGLTLSGGVITNNYSDSPPSTGAQCALAVNSEDSLPGEILTVIRGKTERTLLVAGSLPDGWQNVLNSDGYYYLAPFSRTELTAQSVTASDIQTALEHYDEVHLASNTGSTVKVTLDGDLSIPAGKSVTLEDNVNLDSGTADVQPTLTVNGTLRVGLDLYNYGTLKIGPEGVVTMIGRFNNFGNVENEGQMSFLTTGRSFTNSAGGTLVNRGTIDLNNQASVSIAGSMENYGDIIGGTTVYAPPSGWEWEQREDGRYFLVKNEEGTP